MNILIVGNGGREHALAWKAAQSPLSDNVYVAPGNAGTALEKKVTNIDIEITDIVGLVNFSKENNVSLTIVGTEIPLILGIVDAFQDSGLTIFGPSKKASQLEGSKIFAKNFLSRHHIPTATYQVFTEIEPALTYLKTINTPVVIKPDGLTAGKGVTVAITIEEAKNTIQEILVNHIFGKAGNCILIEEFLEGEEVSFIVMVDGKHIIPLATSQDHKPVGNNNTGPNTGGMGAYSPAPIITDVVHQRIMDQIVYPTIQGMETENRRYQGFLYAGLIIDKKGNPKVIEFNCRLGDPETQPIMMRLQSDIIDLCLSGVNGELSDRVVSWNEQSALGVVMAASGYPSNYRKGDVIHGLSNEFTKEYKIFHSGTKLKKDKIVTNGGRVLCITALGKTIVDAKQKAYQEVKKIFWTGCFYRNDIGYQALTHLK